MGGGKKTLQQARQFALRGLLGSQGRHVLSPFGRRRDHLHLPPVVREFSSAIQASNIRTGQGPGLRPPCASQRYWKAIPGMPAAEKRIDQFCHHKEPSTPRGCLSLGLCCEPLPRTCPYSLQSYKMLDSPEKRMVSSYACESWTRNGQIPQVMMRQRFMGLVPSFAQLCVRERAENILWQTDIKWKSRLPERGDRSAVDAQPRKRTRTG